MKFIKFIGATFLCLLLTASTGFADEELDKANLEITKLIEILNGLKVHPDFIGEFDDSANQLLNTASQTSTNIHVAYEWIKSLENLLKEVNPNIAENIKTLKETNLEIKKLEAELEKLKTDPNIKQKSKDQIDRELTLLPENRKPATNINTARQRIRSLESLLKNVAPDRSCIEDHLFQAETECPFYMHFYTASEFIGSNEFAESFLRSGVQLRSTLWEWEWWTQHRFNFMVDLALTSRVVQTNQDPNNTSIFETKGAKALEGRMGFMLDLFNPTSEYTGYQKYTATNTIALMADIGFDSVEELPAGSGATIDGPSDLFQHHFAGIRVYHRGTNRFNGAYADIGWGISENFAENESKRFKVRGYLPILVFTKTQFKIVTMLEIDSDFKDTPDETKLIVGMTVAPEQFFGWIGDFF
ncbi:MAG: hypothetical protein OEZ51_04990 [Nitrospinota bacterium]|nr:hypothetical protein [Nitrospinota bacterium]